MNTIGDRIRERRLELGMSVEVLAKAVGLKPTTLYDLERGDSKSTTKLHRFADELGLNADWLETGKGVKLWKPRVSFSLAPISDGAAQPLHPESSRATRVEIRGNAIMDKDGFWTSAQKDDDVGHVKWEASEGAFAIQVGTDALDPVIKRGTILVFDAEPPVAGDYAHLVLTDGREAIMEFLFKSDVQQTFQSIRGRQRFTFDTGDIEKVSGYGGQLPAHKRKV
ncbi:hypothetical protein B0E46_15705 [Rhodanobacter sp. B04]|uniref:helix-turn-helix domain-containing protein n=1 Tax=Rhodanobacter sp. B04 TaxID=1945860 RepID=UPI0009D1B150|nr:helix-turn-helix transcriptional regulator [Rhodanobacter sp. B04]OOG61423.1 hypothetical protein B0E46_15705 [Rhodanobacter sp. B04]